MRGGSGRRPGSGVGRRPGEKGREAGLSLGLGLGLGVGLHKEPGGAARLVSFTQWDTGTLRGCHGAK